MKIKALAAVLAVVLAAAGFYAPARVYASTIKQVVFTDEDKTKTYTTDADTVQDFLTEINVTLQDKDTVTPELSAALSQGTEIVVKRGFDILVEIDGADQEVKISAGTQAGPFVLELEKENNEDYIYDGNPAAVLVRGDVVELTTCSEETDTYTRVIPYETQYVETQTLDKGVTQVVQDGVPGECQITEVVKYSGGVEVSREQESVVVTKAPISEIVNVGVGNPVATATDAQSSETFAYSQVLTMNATAYCLASCGKSPGAKGYGLTASGLYVRRGIVSVDPSVIPLGTKLYVEGYGYAVAADTGSAIKGNRIDLYMDTLAECLDFGRQTIKVYVLSDQGN